MAYSFLNADVSISQLVKLRYCLKKIGEIHALHAGKQQALDADGFVIMDDVPELFDPDYRLVALLYEDFEFLAANPNYQVAGGVSYNHLHAWNFNWFSLDTLYNKLLNIKLNVPDLFGFQ